VNRNRLKIGSSSSYRRNERPTLDIKRVNTSIAMHASLYSRMHPTPSIKPQKAGMQRSQGK